MIQVKNLTKRFKKFKAIDNLSLKIGEGEIVGIVGPNGTGKTTLLNIISGLMTTFEGDVERSIAVNEISLASEEFGFPKYYSVKKVLEIFKLIKSASDSQYEGVVSKLSLQPHMQKNVGQLSQGLKQRLNIAVAILGHPKLIILDEPNNGLDPDGFKMLRELITELKKNGKTVIIASHLLNEIERFCDEVIFMKQGKLLSQDTIESILSNHNTLEEAYEFYSK
ncbi:MAG: ATP-binding cassette domain-containing protein [Cyclobacteriaceae bacterium]